MRIATFLVVLFFFPAAHGAETTPLFSSSDTLKAVLTAPIGQVHGQKKQDQRLYMEGSWSYREGEETIRRPVKIRTRGHYRRVNCTNPPLMLNFRKKELADTLFDGQDKLKMVNPCKNGDKFQQLVYVEYLIYQLYALFSDNHFRVRMVEVGYNDTDRPDKPWQSTNFLIQDEDDMAASSGMAIFKIEKPKREELNLAETALVEVFQFMIGNVDYSTLRAREGDCCHNVKLIAQEGATSGFIPVPYDFDSSGILDAPYATLPQAVPIKKITQRYFYGWCKEERRFREAIERVKAKREEALALIENSPLLEKYYRKKTYDYLEKSYEMLDDESYVDRKIIGKCRGEVIKG